MSERADHQREPGPERRGELGATLLTVGLLMPVFLGLMALAVDMSYVFTQRRLVQNVADAGAVSGALMMGKRGSLSSADHDTYSAITQTQGENLKNSAETYAFWLQSWYTNGSGQQSEMVGVPCGDLTAYTGSNGGGVQVVTQRSVPTFFGAFLGNTSNFSANEKQVVTITGAQAGSGYFVLTLSGGDYWTDWLAANATAAQVQAALENLHYNATQTIGAGNVQVTSPNTTGGPWTITFRAGLSGFNVVNFQAYHEIWNGSSWVPSNDVTISTQTDGSGARREVTITGKGTALLKSITGVTPSSSYFAPFALWVGSLPSYKGAESRVVTYYKGSSFIASWVNYNPNASPWADPNWTSSNGTFNGYLNGLGTSTIRLGDNISTSGSGTPSTTKLDAAYNGHYPIVLPVVDRSSDSGGSVSLHVTGWAWVQLDYSGNPAPSSAVGGSSGLKGKIIRWAATGFEVASGTSSGTSVPAKTVVVSPSQ